MSDCVRYPAPGCVVEYLEGNAVQIALVTEEAGGRLRLLLPNRRETRLNSSRLLPWIGPLHAADMGREDAVRLLHEQLDPEPRIKDFKIIASHQESLHSHDAISVLVKGVRGGFTPEVDPSVFATLIHR